jgi:hypothetical protein
MRSVIRYLQSGDAHLHFCDSSFQVPSRQHQPGGLRFFQTAFSLSKIETLLREYIVYAEGTVHLARFKTLDANRERGNDSILLVNDDLIPTCCSALFQADGTSKQGHEGWPKGRDKFKESR